MGRRMRMLSELARDEATIFLYALDDQLDDQSFLHGDEIGATDIAILPFVRQFAHVDFDWFQEQDWDNLKRWLEDFKASERFQAIMEKLPPWKAGETPYRHGHYELGNFMQTH